jgi:hypothetical protein
MFQQYFNATFFPLDASDLRARIVEEKAVTLKIHALSLLSRKCGMQQVYVSYVKGGPSGDVVFRIQKLL